MNNINVKIFEAVDDKMTVEELNHRLEYLSRKYGKQFFYSKGYIWFYNDI